MSKQPYIPLYIGDWKKDTDNISLEAEAALLKLTFKMWDNSAKGSLLIRLSNLALMCKKSESDTLKIVHELRENEVLEVGFGDENWILFGSRRMKNDARKSLINSENGKQGGRPSKKEKAKLKQTESELKAKEKQIPEYDIDNESDIDSKNGIEIKKPKIEKFNPSKSIPETWDKSEFLKWWDIWVKSPRRKKAGVNPVALMDCLEELIEKAPKWEEAAKRLKAAAGGGWIRLFYVEQKNGTPKQADHDPRHSSTFKFDKA